MQLPVLDSTSLLPILYVVIYIVNPIVLISPFPLPFPFVNHKLVFHVHGSISALYTDSFVLFFRLHI